MILWRHCFKRQQRCCSRICTYSSLRDMLASTTFHKSKKKWTEVVTLSDRLVNAFEIAAPWGKYSPTPFLTEELVLWRHSFKRQPRCCSPICTYSSLRDMLASINFHKSEKKRTKVATLYGQITHAVIAWWRKCSSLWDIFASPYYYRVEKEESDGDTAS